MDKTELDYEAFGRLVDLWSKENPIKTTKLQVLLAVNAGLVSFIHLAGGGLSRSNLWLLIAGAVVSLVWTLSIGRTVLFQKVWQVKIETIARRYPEDPRFQILQTDETERQMKGWLKVLGGVSSKYYLLASPLVFCAGWLLATLYVLSRPA
ncbi:MAG TPA: hypothetical protein VIV57_11995 [Anaeromyxobacter sp.]